MAFEQRVNKKGYTYWQSTDTGEVTWEDPYASSSPAGGSAATTTASNYDDFSVPSGDDYFNTGTNETESENKTQGDWTLYHNEEGE